MAVALHLFAGYAAARLDHAELDKYIEHMWDFVALPGGGVGFTEWVSGLPPLAAAGLGDEFPQGFAAYMAKVGVSKSEFRSVLTHTTELLYSNLYGAADNAGSLRELKGLAAIALAAGAVWPNLSAFSGSRWANGGWGARLSPEQLRNGVLPVRSPANQTPHPAGAAYRLCEGILRSPTAPPGNAVVRRS